MTTLLLTHSACPIMFTPPGHPECADRLRAIGEVLSQPRFDGLSRDEAPEGISIPSRSATTSTTHRAAPHRADQRHGLCRRRHLDVAGHLGSRDARRRRRGRRSRRCHVGKAPQPFVAVRPPGHHAEINRPMGFCFFTMSQSPRVTRSANTASAAPRSSISTCITATHAGYFWADPTVMYCSTHQMPLFPAPARPVSAAITTPSSTALASEDGSAQFRAAFENVILPQLAKFSPELIVISAGFDAHYRDPLAPSICGRGFRLGDPQADGSGRQHRRGRIVSVLEGGYDLQGLKGIGPAHVTALSGA